MIWNWQFKDWPNFTYDLKSLSDYESAFLEKVGVAQGALKHIDLLDRKNLEVSLLSEEAYKTSEIEGEILDRDSLQSSIRRQFGLKAEKKKDCPGRGGH